MKWLFNDPIANLLGNWSVEINYVSVLFRISIVVILASIIGCERSSKRHSAGLRTFVLISFASVIAMIMDLI
ncbi:MAG: MgtC/SapB family protein, partial [Erysipelotrichia bacterium]|nr:MgtC/SapB family protein [Erysipelotrichia bacterium]